MSFYREEKSPSDWGRNRKDDNPGTPEKSPKPEPEGTVNWPSDMVRTDYKDGPRDNNIPAYPLDRGDVENAGGSAKVIPYNKDYENKKDRTLQKAAARMGDIEQYVSDKVKERSRSYDPKLKRVDTKNSMWFFDVGKWEVKVQATIPGRATKLTSVDLDLTCSCPFWRWQGPEHWAQKEDYLYKDPRGTASFPEIRDPNHEHAVCKHVYAVFQKLKTYRLRQRKRAHTLGKVRTGYMEVDRMISSVVRRYQSLHRR